MENELSNTITMILRNLYEDTQDRIRELSNEEMELDRQLQRLSEQIVDHEHFSVLDKLLLKRKQYQAHLESIKKRDLENSEKRIDIRNKRESISRKKYEEKKKVYELEKLIDNPSMIELNTLSNYFNSYQEIEDYCNSKNIKLTSTSKLYFGKDGNDEAFMKEAISEDFRLIVFDKSYSPELYKQVIDQLNEFVKNNFSEIEYRANINLYEEMFSGKYNNHFIKHVMDYLKYICGNGKTHEEMRRIINTYYFSLTQNLDKLYQKYNKENFGKALEKLYENDDFIVGCHATSYKPDGDIIQDDKIFENGIRESNRGTSRAMNFTVAYNIPFLEVLDYDQNRYGTVSGGYAYILTIPKAVVMQQEPLWGIGEDGYNYILPDFVYGKYKQTSDNQELIINTNTNKKIYENQDVDRSQK